MSVDDASRQLKSPERWYADGLRFECSRCGHCCRGAGNVWVSDADVASLAQALEVSDAELRSLYTRRLGRSGVVLRQQRNQDCVFWHPESGCQVYAQRPRQCRTYPFWRAIVHSRESWEEEASSCPGIGRGSLHAAEGVEASAAADGIPEHRTRRGASGT